MKDAILKGHPLTDDVMKEVKGGLPNYNQSKKNLVVCVGCDSDLVGEPQYDKEAEAWRLYCSQCGSYTTLPEMPGML